MPDITKGAFLSGNTRLYDVKTYKLSGDVTSLPISVQAINNSDEGPTVITEFVNIKDETVWIQSYKEYSGSHGGGLGQSMVQELDPDGKPKLYTGNINKLIRIFMGLYNYSPIFFDVFTIAAIYMVKKTCI